MERHLQTQAATTWEPAVPSLQWNLPGMMQEACKNIRNTWHTCIKSSQRDCKCFIEKKKTQKKGEKREDNMLNMQKDI